MTEASGKPVTGPVELEVNFFRTDTGGDPIPGVGPLSFGGVTLKDGVFQITIALSPIDFHTVFADTRTSVFVEVTDVTHQRTYPRQSFSVVPYALKVPVDGKSVSYNGKGEVTIPSLSGGSDGQVLTRQGEGFTWTTPTASLDALLGKPLGTATPLNGQVLTFDGAKWVPATPSGGGGGGVTSVSVTTPLAVSNPTTTPQLSMTQASSVSGGYLSASDWLMFSGKEPAIATGTTSQYLRGDKTWQALPVASNGTAGVIKATTGKLTVDGTGAITNITADSAAAFTGSFSGDLTGGQATTAIAPKAVTTAKLDEGAVTDAKVSATAAIATSKLSGPVTAIAGHGLGTAAAQDVGTAAGNVVQLLTGGKLPAVDGSNLTNLSSASINWATPGTIGSTTPNSGAFSTLSVGTNASTQLLQVGSHSYPHNARVATAAGDNTNFRTWSIGTDYGDGSTNSPNFDFTIRDEYAGIDRFVIDLFTGNVGMGTTNPNSPLTIRSATSDIISLAGPNGNATRSIAVNTSDQPITSVVGARINFVDDTNFGAHVAIATGSGGNTTTTERFRVTSNGNVGIGTPNPAARLAISGKTLDTDADQTVAVQSQDFAITKDDNSTKQFYGMKIMSTLNTGSSNANTTLDVLRLDTVNTSTTGLSTYLINAKYGGAGKFAVDTMGYLFTPAGLANYTNANNAKVFVSASGAQITRQQADANPALVVQQVDAGSTGDVLQLKNSSSTLFTVQQGGKVGIGTTSPAYKLDVTGSVNASTSLCIAGTCKTSWPSGGNPGFDSDPSAPANALYIDNWGKVGVGLLYPSVKLDVNGSIGIAPGYSITAANGSFNLGGTNPDETVRLLSGSSADIVVQPGAGRNTIFSNGNVGIGTATPETILDVGGEARIKPTTAYPTGYSGKSLVLRYDAVSGNDFAAVASYDYTAAAYKPLHFFGSSISLNPAGGNTIIGGTNPAGSRLAVVGGVAVGSYAGVNAAPANGMIVSGRVGIGNTSPGYPLDVVGDVNTSACFKAGGVNLAGGCASDARFKTDVHPLAGALKKFSLLNPVRYRYRAADFPERHFSDGPEYGFIAQELETVFPEFVSTDADGYKRVHYGLGLQMQTIAALKELKSETESEIERLRADNAQIKEWARALARDNAELKADRARNEAEMGQIKADSVRKDAEIGQLKAYLCAKDPAADFCSSKTP